MPKTVLITGTSSGFGRDTAETLARAGRTVYASMRDIAGRNTTNMYASLQQPADATRAGDYGAVSRWMHCGQSRGDRFDCVRGFAVQ